jgi:hypothetical protein
VSPPQTPVSGVAVTSSKIKTYPQANTPPHIVTINLRPLNTCGENLNAKRQAVIIQRLIQHGGLPSYLHSEANCTQLRDKTDDTAFLTAKLGPSSR